jgi:hypothetical protein
VSPAAREVKNAVDDRCGLPVMNVLTLAPHQHDSVAWLTIERFSRLVDGLSGSSAIAQQCADLRRVVRPIIDGSYTPDDLSLLGVTTHAAGRLMESVGEEPAGAEYYPFKAAELIAMSGEFLLTTPRNEKAFELILQWMDRYAGHIDWHMRSSRIWPDRPGQFPDEETLLRLALSRLTGARDADYAAARAEVVRLADRQMSAIRCCLAPESSCQYVVTVRMSAAELAGVRQFELASGPDADGRRQGRFAAAGRRVDVAVSETPVIYFSTNSDQFDRDDADFAFVHVWDPAPALIRDMVEAIGPRALWVDYRDRGERLIDAQQFHEVMAAPDQAWP